jgi:ParB family chromosome partitioning protein
MTDQALRNIPLSKLKESPHNPRKRFDPARMKELIENVKKNGILNPLLVRPIDEDFEIISGHRRSRAAAAAKLESVPAVVKNLNDVQARELQMIEIMLSEGIHPLEEAHACQDLLQIPGNTIETLVTKLAKSETYIYQRLSLVNLIDKAQKLFMSDAIQLGHAVALARLQIPDQEKAIDHCYQDRYDFQIGKQVKQACSVKELQSWIERELMLDLHSAPFKKDDAELYPAAGACVACPKRTGFSPALFPDIKKADTCTDSTCFNEKIDRFIKQAFDDLTAKSLAPLKISSEYTSGRAKGKSEILTRDEYRKIENKKDRCENVRKAIVVSGSDRGQIFDICTDSACKLHGVNITSRSSRNPAREQEKKIEQERKKKRAIRSQILTEVVQKIDKLTRDDLEIVVLGFWFHVWADLRKMIVSRRGWTPEKKEGSFGYDYDAIIRKQTASMDEKQLSGFLVELAISRQVDGVGFGEKRDRIIEFAKNLKVDVAAITKQITADFEAKQAKKKPAKKIEKKQAAAKKQSKKN